MRFGGDRGKLLLLLILIGGVGLTITPLSFLGLGGEESKLSVDYHIFTYDSTGITDNLRNPGVFKVIPENEAKIQPGRSLAVVLEYNIEEFETNPNVLIISSTLKIDYGFDEPEEIENEEDLNPNSIKTDAWMQTETAKTWTYSNIENLLLPGEHTIKLKGRVEIEEASTINENTFKHKAEEKIELKIKIDVNTKTAVIKVE